MQRLKWNIKRSVRGPWHPVGQRQGGPVRCDDLWGWSREISSIGDRELNLYLV